MTTNSPRRHANGPTREVPVCHDRQMILRNGPRGAFYGCRAYPACKRTVPANVTEPLWFKKAGAK